MKKLLSLLSVLTISSCAIPTTIAASPYQKENNNNNLREKMESDSNNKKEKNNKITLTHKNKNTLWKTVSILGKTIAKTTDNIKNNFNSKRKKRNINFLTTEIININLDKKNYFENLFNKVLKKLLDNNIIISIKDKKNPVTIISETNYFVINPKSNYEYFIVPFNIDIENQKIIELIFRVNDFYVQGFTYNNNFYHFSDSTVKNTPNKNSQNLKFDSGYKIKNNSAITWTGINQAFYDLFNYGSDIRYRNNIFIIQAALSRIFLATSESMRFREVRRILIENDTSYWDNFRPIILNWNSITKKSKSYLENNRNSLNNF